MLISVKLSRETSCAFTYEKYKQGRQAETKHSFFNEFT